MSLPQHLREEVLMLSSANFWMCFAGLIYLVAGFFILRKEISAARGGQAHHLGLYLHRRFTRCIRPRAFRRPDGSPGYGPVLDAGALVLGVFRRMRAVRSSNQSYGEEVRTLVVHPARIDVLTLCLHDACTECARGSQKSIRVGCRAKRSLFCLRRMGSQLIA